VKGKNSGTRRKEKEKRHVLQPSLEEEIEEKTSHPEEIDTVSRRPVEWGKSKKEISLDVRGGKEGIVNRSLSIQAYPFMKGARSEKNSRKRGVILKESLFLVPQKRCEGERKRPMPFRGRKGKPVGCPRMKRAFLRVHRTKRKGVPSPIYLIKRGKEKIRAGCD